MTDRTDRAPGAEATRDRKGKAAGIAAGLAASVMVAGCTGGETMIDFGPNGPIPPAAIASVSTSGAPPYSAASLGAANDQLPTYDSQPQYAAAAPAAPAGTVERIPSSSLPPPPGAGTVQPAASGTIDPLPAPPADAPDASLPAPASGGPVQQAAIAPDGQMVGEVQFLPLIGVPREKAELLARALSDSAASEGLRIRPAAEAKTNIRLKGYFSAFPDGSNTTLVYVWDVLDANDQRTRRIQGQESVPGTAADPWGMIDQNVLDAVAAKTMDGARAAVSEAG